MAARPCLKARLSFLSQPRKQANDTTRENMSE
jgi:hypothetical protein